jgi:glycine cleavage system H protein
MSELTVHYTKEHDHLRQKGTRVIIGISHYAQEQLGDVVYLELPPVGKSLKKGEDAVVIESVKAASEVKAPATGSVVEVNEKVNASPELVNADPEGEGWLFVLDLLEGEKLEDTMTPEDYQAYLKAF